MDKCIELLLRSIDEAFEKSSWHGTNLRGSIRSLTAEEAAWRPAPGRHNIWEIVVHAAYWKYAVGRRILGEKRRSFPLKGSDWFARPVAGIDDTTQWRSDVALLVATHAEMRETIARLRTSDLDRRSGKRTVQMLVTGIAAHDLYHAGQIQLLKRLRG